MISFRFHLVSVVAVILALALGVLVGASVLDKGLVDTLKRDTEEAQALADRLQREVRVLDAQMDAVKREIVPAFARDRLVGERVVIVVSTTVSTGADDPVVSGAMDALEEIGRAEVIGVLFVGPRVAAEDEEARLELADLLGLPADADPADLSEAAARQLGARLAGVPRGDRDLLRELIEGGFLCPEDCPGMTDEVVAGLGSRDDLVVILAGDAEEPVPAPDAFAVPLVEELVRRGVTVAAGEGAAADYAFVDLLRSDGPAAEERLRVVTVDDLDLPLGEMALVLGLRRLDDTGVGGNYGDRGADEHLP